ncbi:hypothetical protein B566_EDAN001611 [Ephemera danica]|nr:hypothetical protein B566_EDAN001611 [Ephemera danica]
MALIEGMPGELDSLNSQCFKQESLVATAVVTDAAQLEFRIPGQGDHYVDLSRSLFNVKVKLLKADNTAYATTDIIAPVNNLLDSLFSDVKVELNQKQISDSRNMYHYRAYLEDLFNFNNTSKKKHQTVSLWFQDEAGKFEDATNKGLLAQKEFLNGGKTLGLAGKLHCDLFNTSKFILNVIDIRFPYPYKRVEMHNYTISMGSQHHTIENMFLGRIPCRVIIGLVSHPAFSGSFLKNQYNFQHFDVNYLTLFKNCEQLFSRPYAPTFGTDATNAMPYIQSFINTGNHLADDGYCVSMKDWQNGHCLYPFDLTPDLSAHEQHWCIQEKGNLQLEIGTKTPFTEAVTLIVYAEFREILEIDKNRESSIEMARTN